MIRTALVLVVVLGTAFPAVSSSAQSISGHGAELAQRSGGPGGGVGGGPGQGRPGQQKSGGFPPPLQRMDADRDGRISREEFTGPPHRFATMDADGDGYVTVAEFHAFRQRMQAGSGPGNGGPGGPGTGTGGGPGGGGATGQRLPIVNAHVHIDPRIGRGREAIMNWSEATEVALAHMDENGVRYSIVMAPPLPTGGHGRDDWSLSSFAGVVRKHPSRIGFLGGGASLNGMIHGTDANAVSDSRRRDFAAEAERIIAAGALGFGELTALHFSMRGGHPFVRSAPDHPLFLLLADISAQAGLPMDIHMEAVAGGFQTLPQLLQRSNSNPRKVDDNIGAFEKLLSHNRGAKIIWAHVGWDNTGHRSPALMRRLLAAHPNLYNSFKIQGGAVNANPVISRETGLDSDWRQLMIDFPDRFLIGSDGFYTSGPDRRAPNPDLRPHHRLLGSLPPKVAKMVAHENAEKLFRIPPAGG